VPTLCLAEASYLGGVRLGWRSEVHLLAAFEAAELSLEPLHPADLERVAELVRVYGDLPLGTADAAVVATAERLGVTAIATLDRRHFSVVRPVHADAFELLP
jgi:predicted nucleic acid-binding protein